MARTLFLQGNSERLALPDASVHMIACSPPYYGLRDYSAPGQIGIEATPTQYVERLVRVFRECWRVLRDDGVVFLNLMDSYANDAKWGGATGGKHSSGLHGPTGVGRNKKETGAKAKELIGIPWLVALALRADGWYLRQDVIWAKPNPMPESTRDRFTRAHEYVFVLTKRPHYYWDGVAVAEPAVHAGKTVKTNGNAGMDAGYDGHRTRDGFRRGVTVGATRNRRSVLTINTRGYRGAHFATWPEALVEIMIKAGSSERGCCPDCGAPWERVTSVTRHVRASGGGSPKHAAQNEGGWSTSGLVNNTLPEIITLGWLPGCGCYGFEVPALPDLAEGLAAPLACAECGGAGGETWTDLFGEQRRECRECNGSGWEVEPSPEWSAYAEELARAEAAREALLRRVDETAVTVPARVLDPFVGSGTTAAVAARLGRVGIGVDLNLIYLAKLATRRATTQMLLVQ